MFTNNYLNLVRGTFQYTSSGSNVLAKITADVKLTNNQEYSAVYSTGTTTSTTIVTDTMDLLKVLFFSGTPFKYNYPSTSYLGCLQIGLDQKDSISPSDYTMNASFYSYMSVSRSGDYLLVTVNNTSSSDLNFNTLQIGCVMHINNTQTSNSDSSYILLSEFDLGQQTLAPGYSKTFRIISTNPSI